MKANWIEINNLVIGVVYRYYTADGKSYVGCTINEKKRKYAWNWKNNSYGGWKIADARKTLGLSAFTYEVLDTIFCGSKKELTKRLEAIETVYIEKFDSFNNGYNTNKGGRGNKGCSLSATHKANISKSNSIPLILINVSNGVVTKEKSLSSAAITLDVSVSTIFNHLHKLVNQPIKGYKLKFAA